jgi:hypothetical protein
MVGAGLIVLGLAVAIAVVLGPLISGAIDFRTSEAIENQFVGSEIVSLVLVAPIATASGILWLRRNRLAPALAFAPALYSVYTYGSAVLGQEYGRYEGNIEKAFPLYALLVAGSVLLSAAAWSRIVAMELATPSPHLRRTLAIVLVGVGGMIALAWAHQIWLVLIGDPPTEYLEGPTCFWVIKLFDLGFVVPAAIGTGIGVWRSRPMAIRLAYELSGYLTCMAAAVTCMAITTTVTNDPSSQPLVLLVLIPATVALGALTMAVLRLAADAGRSTSSASAGTSASIAGQPMGAVKL